MMVIPLFVSLLIGWLIWSVISTVMRCLEGVSFKEKTSEISQKVLDFMEDSSWGIH